MPPSCEAAKCNQLNTPCCWRSFGRPSLEPVFCLSVLGYCRNMAVLHGRLYARGPGSRCNRAHFIGNRNTMIMNDDIIINVVFNFSQILNWTFKLIVWNYYIYLQFTCELTEWDLKRIGCWHQQRWESPLEKRFRRNQCKYNKYSWIRTNWHSHRVYFWLQYICVILDYIVISTINHIHWTNNSYELTHSFNQAIQSIIFFFFTSFNTIHSQRHHSEKNIFDN